MTKELGVTLCDYDMCAVHRLPSRKGTPDIIVKRLCTETKIDLIKRVKKKRLQIQGLPVYLSERIMPGTKILLKEAKQLKGEGRVKFVWTRNGDQFVRRSEGESAKIRNSSDLKSGGLP